VTRTEERQRERDRERERQRERGGGGGGGGGERRGTREVGNSQPFLDCFASNYLKMHPTSRETST